MQIFLFLMRCFFIDRKMKNQSLRSQNRKSSRISLKSFQLVEKLNYSSLVLRSPLGWHRCFKSSQVKFFMTIRQCLLWSFQMFFFLSPFEFVHVNSNRFPIFVQFPHKFVDGLALHCFPWQIVPVERCSYREENFSLF